VRPVRESDGPPDRRDRLPLHGHVAALRAPSDRSHRGRSPGIGRSSHTPAPGVEVGVQQGRGVLGQLEQSARLLLGPLKRWTSTGPAVIGSGGTAATTTALPSGSRKVRPQPRDWGPHPGAPVRVAGAAPACGPLSAVGVVPRVRQAWPAGKRDSRGSHEPSLTDVGGRKEEAVAGGAASLHMLNRSVGALQDGAPLDLRVLAALRTRDGVDERLGSR